MVTLKQTEGKLIKLKQKIVKSDFLALKVSKEDFEKLVETEMIRQFADILVPKMEFKTKPTKGGGFDVEAEGFFFSRKEFYSLLIEISELSDNDREELKLMSKKQL